VGARRKHPAGQHSTAKARRPIANNAVSISNGKAASDKAYLEQENVTTTEDNKQEEVSASTPQEKPHSTPADTAHQAEQEITAMPVEKIEQPTPPRVPGKPVKTRVLPERQAADSPPLAAHHPGQAAPADPAAGLADLNWMPPAEDQVARFLNDVADIAPPPTRERDEGRIPNFMVPAATSPEAAKRKKAKAEPFWSQVVATPMEQPALPPETSRSRHRARNRSRLPLRWLIVAGIVVLLVIGALAVLVLTHHLPLKGI